MTSVRDVFFNRIYELVQDGEDIYIITADLGAPSLDDFRKDFPDRYISVGIAEQNLISVAAGMAMAGKKVIAYGLNPFPATRAFDQIRTLLAELNIPLTVCALNAGVCAAECGYTHMPIEDMAILRTLSNVRVFNPSDEVISYKLADDTCSLAFPRFIRFDKFISGKRYTKQDIDFDRGYTIAKRLVSRDRALSIVANGIFIPKLIDLLNSEKYDRVQLIDMYGVPVDELSLITILNDSDNIITIEENVLPGGIGAYILEILSDYNICKPVRRLGLKFAEGYYDVYTSREYIERDQGLDDKAILRNIDDILEMEGDK